MESNLNIITHIRNRFLWFGVSAVGSMILLAIPVFIQSIFSDDMTPAESPVSYVFKNLELIPTIFLLMVWGGILGFFSRSWFLIGLATMGLFYVVAIFEIMDDSTTHDMWPIEFIFYFGDSLFAIFGAFIGKTVRSKIAPGISPVHEEEDT